MADAAKPQMEYRFLGPTGLKVSVLGFGNWLTSDDPKNEERTKELIKKSYDSGINFFDTAEGYGAGKGEIAFGKAFKELALPREQIVVSTKLFFGGAGVNDMTLTRKHIIEGANNSLKRLQLDYVDIIFAHRPDYATPVEETCRAFDYLINHGKAFYWGTSEWPADRIVEAYACCDRLGLIRPIVEQPQYSMVVRERFEKEYSLLFREHEMGTTIWSPLAGGILTGKYNESIPEGSRFDSENPLLKGIFERYFAADKKEETHKKLQGLGAIAKEVGCSQAQLALAWTLVNPNVSVCLFGATKESQLDDNLKAVEIYKKLTPEILERIEKILGNKPEAHFDFRAKTGLQKHR
jgi:voltage-dependent potassium channel beta subunit